MTNEGRPGRGLFVVLSLGMLAIAAALFIPAFRCDACLMTNDAEIMVESVERALYGPCPCCSSGRTTLFHRWFTGHNSIHNRPTMDIMELSKPHP